MIIGHCVNVVKSGWNYCLIFDLYFCDEMQKHQMIQCAVLQLRGKQYFIISIPHTQKTVMCQIHDVHSEEITQKVSRI